jgi:hypothetical protein
MNRGAWGFRGWMPGAAEEDVVQLLSRMKNMSRHRYEQYELHCSSRRRENKDVKRSRVEPNFGWNQTVYHYSAQHLTLSSTDGIPTLLCNVLELLSAASFGNTRNKESTPD